METSGSATHRLVLGRDLKELREKAGITREQVAAHLSWYVAKISKIEQGQATLKANDITALLTFYGADPEEVQRIQETGALARKRGSFGKVADWARQYLGLEGDAVALNVYDTELIHGLFQTPEYAQAVVSTSAVVAAVDIPRVVESRMRRQVLLERQSPPEIHLILGEAALRREIGGAAVLAAQIRRLVTVADLAHVTVQILPFAAGQHAALGSGFTLLTVPVGTSNKSWAYLEDLTRADLLDGDSHVNAYGLAFRTLTETALSARESISLMDSIALDLERSKP
ncbi:helix-turn-helix domain-containing protein [Amycolatopsis sp. H20-H5]|uniref:helix-turn-helix domain-containing protein n=1 Tax=Amycolatopsis sp. H20-H5 TaxID=3046309 RepID=UPI002DBFBDFE|nr:helix-turn-helix transcriptional regulator [Amycolatopsis sp. H20-H5]MEC3974721.1 helix-turn-helix transcriptional regulator [Amycolatopsis sp. H20-H5]